MKELIKKYTVTVILIRTFSYIIPIIVLGIFPALLTKELPNGGSSTIGIGFLQNWLRYLFNIVIIVMLIRDLKPLNIKSVLLLMLTFFSSLTAVIIFLFVSFEKNLLKNEK